MFVTDSFDVEIICIADDTQKFADTLYFVIKEGVDKEVQLKARGVGTTIFRKNLDFISFGTVFTFREQIIETFIENKGRRKQTLKWTKKNFGKVDGKNKMIKGDERQVSTQKTGKSSLSTNSNSVKQFNIPDTFSIVPNIVELPPKTGFTFKFKAYSAKVGKLSENFVLTAQIGNERKR